MVLTRTQQIVIGALLVVACVALIAVAAGRGGDGSVKVVDSEADRTAGPAQVQANSVLVHVIGAVQRPNVYELPSGARVYDAVRAAGGFVAYADSQAINLAATVKDGDQVFIPTRAYSRSPSPNPVPRSGIAQMQPAQAPVSAQTPRTAPWRAPTAPSTSDRTSSATPTPTAPSPGSSDPTPSATDGRSRQQASAGGDRASSDGSSVAKGSVPRPAATGTDARRPSPPAAGVSFPVRINGASEHELQALPRIGPSLAARIVAYRNLHGPFQRIEDLTKVRGIGDKTVVRLAPYIAL